jgi:hypothetical protein
MNFDLRLPIGGLFTICGLILMITGLVQRVSVLGINVNLWWGLVLLAFGAFMLFLGLRAPRGGKAA